jgi:DNA end-binding protein Ku
MRGRPTWQGHLKLSLVSCPVALYAGVARTGDVHFNLLHATTHNRIRMIPTDPKTGPVGRSEIVKGFEVDKDRYVIVTDQEIRGVRLESMRTIDIERFVDAADIDRLYWNEPYFLVPDGKMAVEAYSVIREAMSRTDRIALGRVVMHTRERLLAIEPRDNGLVAFSLRSRDEVRDPADAFDEIPDSKADAAMVDIAEKIIDQLAGRFDPSQFVDRYEEALKALIAEKEEGVGHTVAVEEPADTKVVDLMQALRRSLEAGDRRPAPAHRPASRRTSTGRARKAPARRKAS